MLLLLATLLMAMAAGCALKKPYPDKSYHLPDVAVTQKAPPLTPSFTERIKVRNVKVASPYEGKSFVYRLGDDQWTTDFYHEWFTYPRDILTENCVAYLSQKGAFGLVSTEDSLVEADFYLEGALLSFHLDRRTKESMSAVVKTRWVLIPNKPLFNAAEKGSLWTKEIEQRAGCGMDTPQAFTEATATALGQTFESLNSALIHRFKTPGNEE